MHPTARLALLSLVLSTPVFAADADAPKTDVDVSALYAAWGLTQSNFLLGADHPLDDATYTVQMLRLNVKATRGGSGLVARADLAQGWWGVDNSPAPEGDSLFLNKGTGYGVHLDRAWAFTTAEVGTTLFEVRVGRQLWRAGHGLVLDQDIDGVRLFVRPSARVEMVASWGKMSEGLGSTKGPKGLLMSDNGDFADANVFALTSTFKLGGGDATKAPTQIDGWVLGYVDNSGDDKATYLPEGLGYARSRFTPNISSAVVVGVAAKTTLDVAEGLLLDGEIDYLTGRDDVTNEDYRGGAVDKNDGQLSGYNLYFKAKQKLDIGVPVDGSLLFGMGSGDQDPRDGAGNINRLATMGFFPLTNVWEDSVMPDIEGISPQGLGSPVSRGYRELENTTALQGKIGCAPHKSVRIEASYTYLRATAPVYAWDDTGPLDDNSQDLGQEVDLNLTIKIRKNVIFKSLAGVFIPGEAAGFLMNGTNVNLEPAMELKNVFVVKI